MKTQDRRPLEFEGRFLWHPVPSDGSIGDQFDYLPPAMFARLDGFIPRENPRVSERVKAYPTRDEAMDAYRRATATRSVSAHNPLRGDGAGGWTTAGNSEGI